MSTACLCTGQIRHSPADYTGKCGVGAYDTEERSEVLNTNVNVRDVDSESDRTKQETREDEWRAQFDAVRPHGEDHRKHDWSKDTI